jgi:Zn-dependent M28 family amino/carboxypeptidase
MTFTGEEEGLFGSEYYVKNPVFPLEKTVADLNIDMVGRVDDAHKDNKNFVYVIGADRLSSELHEINESSNNTYTHLSLDYTYKDENDPEQLYYRSDHWNFASKNIPVIFYTSGLHADYHQVTDEVRHIAFGPLTLRTQCVFYTAWEIANRDERLRVDKMKK